MLKLLLIIPILQIVCTSAQDSTIQNATQTESPWMVYFEVKGRRCGGAMIDDTHILTAAHCFDRVKYSEFTNLKKLREAVIIRIGEWKMGTDPDCGEDESEEICDTTADILPKEVIIHEKYNKRDQDSRFQYDIAIIKLGWPPRRSEVINVLKLEDPERCHEAVSGEFWKTTGFGGNSQVKKRMEMVLLSHEECEKSIDESHLEKLYEAVHVCGRGLNGEKTCKGDSGNPVTNLVEGIPYLQGIVTFTDDEECVETETNTASVFLRVPCFFDWIHSKVPNITASFTEKPKTTTSENKDTGDIDTYVAGESTNAPQLGTTLTPRTTTTTTQKTKPNRRIVPSRPSGNKPTTTTTTATTTVSNEGYDEEDEEEPEPETQKPTTRPTTRPTTTTTTWKTTRATRPSPITTTEDETIHFEKTGQKNPNFSSSSASSHASSSTGNLGDMYDVRLNVNDDDKEEEVATTTQRNSKISRTRVTRPPLVTRAPKVEDDY